MNNYGVVLLVAELATIGITVGLGILIKKIITSADYKPNEEKNNEYKNRIQKANKEMSEHNKKRLQKIKENKQADSTNVCAIKTMAEKIAELDDLLAKGEITQEQYKEQKNKVIMEA